jgi:hypothetical protein
MINFSYDKFFVRKKFQLYPVLLRIIYLGVQFEDFMILEKNVSRGERGTVCSENIFIQKYLDHFDFYSIVSQYESFSPIFSPVS